MAFRMLLFDRAGEPLGELSKEGDELISATRVEEINGTHSLSVTTTRHLEEGTRALTKGFDGDWHEWVLNEPDESHESGAHATGNYKFVWSLQYDLQTVCGDITQPGMASPCTARTALNGTLLGTAMWRVGTVTVMTKSQLIMAFDTAWDRLSSVVKYWGGEVDVTIAVGETGVTDRRLNLLKQVGSDAVTRRFEWGYGLTSISRSPASGPYVCRIIPLGKGETEIADDGETTFEWKLDIGSVNGGRIYLQDDEAAATFRTRNLKGEWEYPTKNVTYSTDDPAELKQFGREDLHYHTRPTVTYEGRVSQFAAVGMDVSGLHLGDVVQIVDRGFNEDAPLRLEERVIKMEIDELGKDDVRLTIGKLTPSIERTIAAITSAVGIPTIAPYVSDFDPSRYLWDMPELNHYTVSAPDTNGFTYAAPAYDFDFQTSEYAGSVAEIADAVQDILDGTAYVDWSGTGEYLPLAVDEAASVATVDGVTVGNTAIGGVVSSGAAAGVSGAAAGVSGVGGDNWVHQIDGVTYSTGTINFSTVSSGGISWSGSGSSNNSSSGSGSSSSGSGSSSSSWGSTKPKSSAKTKNTTKISTATTGSKTIDLNDPWTSSGGVGEIIDPWTWLITGGESTRWGETSG